MTVTVGVAVTVTVTVTVGVTVGVTVRVAVLVVTVVVVAWTLVPLAVLVAEPLDGPCDLAAPLFGVELAHASLVHVRGNCPACVLAGRRLRIDAVVFHKALGVCFPSEHCALGFVRAGLEAIEALLEHRGRGKLASLFTGRWLGLFARLRALGVCFPSERATLLLFAIVATAASGAGLRRGTETAGAARAALDASVVDLLGMTLTLLFAGRWLGVGAGPFIASRENLAGFSVAAIYGPTLIETLHLMLSGLRFTNLLTGRRRAFLHALEEAVDRAAKARLAVTAVVRARIEDGKRSPNALVTALAGGHAFPIGSLVENSRKLGPVASGVATAAL
jgi:hypothetical protein